MPKKRFSAEQIVLLLRQIEVLVSQGKGAPAARAEKPGFRSKLRDECLNGEIFYSLKEATVVIEHRAMAQALQHDQAALIPELSAADIVAERLHLDRGASMQ